MTTEIRIYHNLRKFEVELNYNGDLNLAVIKENGKEIWSIFANSSKSLKMQVTKWCKQNWF
jgi:hypothetical protein